MKVRAFNEISVFEYFESIKYDSINEMKQESKEKIININEQEYIDYLYEKYKLELLKLIDDSETVEEPQRGYKTIDSIYGTSKVEVYRFTVRYNYLGSYILFRLQPSSRILISHDIEINNRSQTVKYTFDLLVSQKTPEAFNDAKRKAYDACFKNIGNINNDAVRYNQQLKEDIARNFSRLKKDYLDENVFFEAIQLSVSKESTSIFNVPVVEKKKIPQPQLPIDKKFTIEPSLAEEIYIDILSRINIIGHSMEKKRSLYVDKDEEYLRDHIVTFLESIYDGTTATAETFNNIGKTDILLKYAKDGSNLFIAECKIWKGIAEFQKAISQLFDRYLTWRDSKTALVVFVKNKEFSTVLNTIKNEISRHEYYVKSNGSHNDTSLSFIFHLPKDKQKQVFLEVMLFHFPE